MCKDRKELCRVVQKTVCDHHEREKKVQSKLSKRRWEKVLQSRKMLIVAGVNVSVPREMWDESVALDILQ